MCCKYILSRLCTCACVRARARSISMLFSCITDSLNENRNGESHVIVFLTSCKDQMPPNTFLDRHVKSNAINRIFYQSLIQSCRSNEEQYLISSMATILKLQPYHVSTLSQDNRASGVMSANLSVVDLIIKFRGRDANHIKSLKLKRIRLSVWRHRVAVNHRKSASTSLSG